MSDNTKLLTELESVREVLVERDLNHSACIVDEAIAALTAQEQPSLREPPHCATCECWMEKEQVAGVDVTQATPKSVQHTLCRIEMEIRNSDAAADALENISEWASALLVAVNTALATPSQDSLSSSCSAGWQPIESAPRDGQHILVADLTETSDGFGKFNGVKQHFAAIAHYWSNLDEEGFYLSSGSLDEPLMRLTHWRPYTATKGDA